MYLSTQVDSKLYRIICIILVLISIHICTLCVLFIKDQDSIFLLISTIALLFTYSLTSFLTISLINQRVGINIYRVVSILLFFMALTHICIFLRSVVGQDIWQMSIATGLLVLTALLSGLLETYLGKKEDK